MSELAGHDDGRQLRRLTTLYRLMAMARLGTWLGFGVWLGSSVVRVIGTVVLGVWILLMRFKMVFSRIWQSILPPFRRAFAFQEVPLFVCVEISFWQALLPNHETSTCIFQTHIAPHLGLLFIVESFVRCNN
jgi:hypothetical protein